jgi:hypothetical protein
MKDYFCPEGHEFDECEVKHYFHDLAVCPFCWPNGFMSKKDTYNHFKENQVEIGSDQGIRFLTSKGEFRMEAGKKYDENFNEIKEGDTNSLQHDK